MGRGACPNLGNLAVAVAYALFAWWYYTDVMDRSIFMGRLHLATARQCYRTAKLLGTTGMKIEASYYTRGLADRV